jgi:ADP-glucose pyrophosphorylase
MIKSFLTLFFSFSIIFLIVAPSAMTILNLEYDQTILMNIAEEESPKEIEVSLENDVKILQSFLKTSYFYIIEDSKEFNFYEEDSSIYTSSILLPPPEFFS